MIYTREEFVKRYGGFINYAIKGTGLLQGTVIAQAIIESQGKLSDGNWRVGASTLSREANNYFGIKCGSNWKGKSYNIDTGEETKSGEKYIEKNACFRAYNSVEESILDYVDFLLTNPRYRKNGVFDAKTVKEQAEALKRAGYATSTTYAETINAVYENVKNVAEKYKSYGFVKIFKSFTHSPIKFVKRNKVASGLTFVMLLSAGIGGYYLLKKKK